MAFDFSKAAGLGTDSIDRSVLGLPFISIIQKGSPEFDETHRHFKTKGISGCRPGQLVFEPTREILEVPLLVVPFVSTVSYTEWKPNKGGFVGSHDVSIVTHREYKRGQKGTPTEYKEYLGPNEIVFTMTFGILFFHKGVWTKGLISFTSKQLRAARQWSKALLGVKLPGTPEGYTPPIFSSKWSLITVPDSNDKGGWFGWEISKGDNLNAETDQAVLEQAFSESTQALAALGAPKETPALPESVDKDVPY